MGKPLQFSSCCSSTDSQEPQPCPQAQTPARTQVRPGAGEKTRKEGELVGKPPALACVPIDCVTGWGSGEETACLSVYTRVDTWMHMYLCTHTCASMCAHLRPHTRARMSVCKCVCVHSVCKHVHMCTHVCAFVCAQLHKCLYSMCMCVHVCVWAVSGRGRESRAGGWPRAAVRLPQSCQPRRSLGGPWPPPLSLAPGSGQAGQGLEPAQARANDQPALGGGAAAQACLSARPRPRPRCREEVGQEAGGGGGRCAVRRAVGGGDACGARQQGAGSRHPVPAVLRSGAQVRGL